MGRVSDKVWLLLSKLTNSIPRLNQVRTVRLMWNDYIAATLGVKVINEEFKAVAVDVTGVLDLIVQVHGFKPGDTIPIKFTLDARRLVNGMEQTLVSLAVLNKDAHKMANLYPLLLYDGSSFLHVIELNISFRSGRSF